MSASRATCAIVPSRRRAGVDQTRAGDRRRRAARRDQAADRPLRERHAKPLLPPREDVEDAKLEASGTRGVCPYKGRASYWSARAGNRLLEDVAVAYHGSGDAAKVAGHVCFVGPGIEVWVDGEPVH
jgi:uncharacterized protein (DUF427 family)